MPLTGPTVLTPHTHAICQIDRLNGEEVGIMLQSDLMYSLIDIDLLVN